MDFVLLIVFMLVTDVYVIWISKGLRAVENIIMFPNLSNGE